jgi:hypothetical protein
MRTSGRHFASIAACLALQAAAQAAVTVNYVHAPQFSDLPKAPAQRQQALDDIGAHFQALGQGLPAGQDLVIDVLDIDLAGREAPDQAAGGSARLPGGDGPRMRLRYTLLGNGRVLGSGDSTLGDQVLGRAAAGASADDPAGVRWPAERRMIDAWWRATIVPQPASTP